MTAPTPIEQLAARTDALTFRDQLWGLRAYTAAVKPIHEGYVEGYQQASDSAAEAAATANQLATGLARLLMQPHFAPQAHDAVEEARLLATSPAEQQRLSRLSESLQAAAEIDNIRSYRIDILDAAEALPATVAAQRENARELRQAKEVLDGFMPHFGDKTYHERAQNLFRREPDLAIDYCNGPALTPREIKAAIKANEGDDQKREFYKDLLSYSDGCRNFHDIMRDFGQRYITHADAAARNTHLENSMLHQLECAEYLRGLQAQLLPEAEVVQGLAQIIADKPDVAAAAAWHTVDDTGRQPHYDSLFSLRHTKDVMAHHQAAATAFADAAAETAPVIGLGRTLEGIKDRDAAEMLPLERPISPDFAAISFYLPRNAARLEAYWGAYTAGEAIVPQPIPTPVFTVRAEASHAPVRERVPVLRV